MRRLRTAPVELVSAGPGLLLRLYFEEHQPVAIPLSANSMADADRAAAVRPGGAGCFRSHDGLVQPLACLPCVHA